MTTRAGSTRPSSKPASQTPQAAGEAHAAEEPRRRRLGVVEVGVGVEPEHAARRGARRATAGSVVMQIEQSEDVRTGKRPRGQRVLDLAAGLEQAAARVAQVVVEAGRRAGSPGVPTSRASTPQALAERLGQRARALGGRRRCGPTSGTAAALTAPSTRGSRFSKNACTPSWMSSVEKAIVSCARRKSSASSSAMSCWRHIASLPSFMSTGDLRGEPPRPVAHGGVELLGGARRG